MLEGTCGKNAFSDQEGFAGWKRQVEEAARKIPVLSEHPHVSAWRKTFKAFGADPTKTRSSAEALLRRIRKGENVPDINPIVDVYNAVSAEFAIPIGGQDLEKVRGDVALRFSEADDVFSPLGTGEPMKVDEGEVLYADSEKVLCSKWNWRDCFDARITENTARFVLFVDGAPGIPRDSVEKATQELSLRLEKFIPGCQTNVRLKP